MFMKRGLLVAGLVLMCVCGAAFGADQAKTGGATPQGGLKFAVSTDVPQKIRSNVPIYNNTLPSHVAVLRMKNLPKLSTSGQKLSFSSRSSSSSSRARALAAARTRAARGHQNDSNHWDIGLVSNTRVSVFREEFVNSLFESKAGKKFTDASRDMIKASENYAFAAQGYNDIEVIVYAYSQGQAELIVKAIIEVFQGYAATARETTAAEIDKVNDEIDKLQKEYDQKSKEREKIMKDLTKAKKQSHYPSTKELKERILRHNVFIEENIIKLEGMEAKRVEINDQIKLTFSGIGEKREKDGTAKCEKEFNLLDELKGMRSKSSIEMRQVRGEYEAAVRIRDKAERYCELYSNLANKDGQLIREIQNIGQTKSRVGQTKSKYAHLLTRDKSEWFMPVVDSNVVTIYSLKPVENAVSK